ncbi:MAG: heme-binding protein [Solirubrobacterales bacterium]|nr:MAG: heme-binding protein [Solirubrobacterales bacterium]
MILEDIQAALAQGRRTAASLGVEVSLAVVDAGGVLRAFEMMDGAEIAGETLAVDKAFTAVAHRISTAELGELAQPGGELFGLQANGHGRYVLIGGGLPITHLGTIVGGAGVSGATSAQDVVCAQAVAEALQARL